MRKLSKWQLEQERQSPRAGRLAEDGLVSEDPSFACLPWGPTFLLPLDGAPDSILSTHLLQAQPRPDGEVMPTLDMALFDWTDYEDLKPEVWPSAKKKGTSTYPAIPVLGRPSSPTICWSTQPDLQMSKVGD